MTTTGAAAPPPATEPAPCRSCGSPLAEGANFCGRCGASRAPPSVAYGADARPRHRAPNRLAPLLRFWLAMLAVNLVGGLVIRALDPDAARSLAIETAMLAAFVGIVLLHLRGRGGVIAPLLRDHGFHRRSLPALAVLAGAGLFVALYFEACERLHLPMVSYLDDYRRADWPLWTAFVAMAVVPPIFEELAFRGVIQDGLQSLMRPNEALLLQAAMFSVLHLAPIVFVSHFVMGLGLGWTRMRTGSLWPSLLAHAAWNAGVLGLELRAGG